MAASCLARTWASSATDLISRRFQRRSGTVDHLRATLGQLGAGDRFLLGEHDHGGFDIRRREREIALPDAARHFHVHEPLDEPVALDELFLELRPFRDRIGIFDADLAEAAHQPRQMRIVIHEPPAQNRRNLVDTVGEEEAAIHDGNARLFIGDEFTVDENDAGHGHLSCDRDGALRTGRQLSGKVHDPHPHRKCRPPAFLRR